MTKAQRAGEWWKWCSPGTSWPTLPLLPLSARDRKGPGAAAVCAFPISDVNEAFDGLYKEVNRETQQWYTDVHPVPEPRPGAVSGEC